jgi:hypothetical protein
MTDSELNLTNSLSFTAIDKHFYTGKYNQQEKIFDILCDHVTQNGTKEPVYYGMYTGKVAKKDKKAFLDDILSIEGCKQLNHNVSSNKSYNYIEQFKRRAHTTCQLLFPKGHVILSVQNSGKFSMEISIINEDIVIELSKICKKYALPYEEHKFAHVIVTDCRGGLTISDIGVPGKELIKNNYSTSAVKSFQKIIEDLRSSDPCGRISVLHGAPGTGKTYYIRGIIEAVNKGLFIIVPPDLIPNLSGPNVLPLLLRIKNDYPNDPMIFILEDADSVLCPRGMDNMSHISGLLNFGDGILGCSLDTRIIATTNADKFDIDKAIKRSGRISQIVEFDALPYNQAAEIFTSLSGIDDLDKVSEYLDDRKITLSDIYAKAKPFKSSDKGKKSDPDEQGGEGRLKEGSLDKLSVKANTLKAISWQQPMSRQPSGVNEEAEDSEIDDV